MKIVQELLTFPKEASDGFFTDVIAPTGVKYTEEEKDEVGRLFAEYELEEEEDTEVSSFVAMALMLGNMAEVLGIVHLACIKRVMGEERRDAIVKATEE